MSIGQDIHMLSCARYFHSEQSAKDLLQSYGLESKLVTTPASYIFVVGKRRDYEGVWMDRKDGYYLLRGSKRVEERSSVLH